MSIKHPEDRRTYCLVLTDEGRALITSLWVEMKHCEDIFLHKLNKDEITQLFKLLDIIEKE
jgi:DNA-binding MarR family transcriptional regulator